VRPGFPQPACGWPAIGGRRRSQGTPCGLVRCGLACGRAEDGRAAADPGGSTVATPACGHRYTTPSSETNRAPKCSMKCAGGGDGGAGGPHWRRVLRRLGDWPTRETTSDSPGCWLGRGRKIGAATIARGHRRRGRGGAGELSHAGAQERVSDGVRGEVRARKVTSTASGEVGRDRGDGAASRRSLARRHGRRRARRPRLAGVYVTVHGVVFRASQNATCYPLTTVRAFKTTATRPSRARRRRGEHGGLGDHGWARKKGPKARPCPHGCGARVLGCTLVSAVARTGTHASRTRHGAPTRRGGDGRSQRPMAREEKLSGRRARRRRQRHLQKTASQPCSKAGLTSSGAAARWRSASARRPGHPHGEGRGRPHLGGHGP
jgi:hypothetical protein